MLPHWREVYACTPLAGGRLLEGYVDLLYRGADGLVVVDYKTAATSDPAALAGEVDGYRLQGASVCAGHRAGDRRTGRTGVFLFLTPAGCGRARPGRPRRRDGRSGALGRRRKRGDTV